MADNTLLLIDGLAVAYRGFYAIRDLATSDGRPTNALFGFVRMVQQLRRLWAPTHWAVVFDGGLPEERTSVLASYKAQREPMPDALEQQLGAVNEYLELARIPGVLIAGQEADDVMASMAVRAEREGAGVLVATSDKDLYQVVSNRIAMVSPGKAAEKMGPGEVREKTGVEPARIIEWLALTGDSVDNIPGVPGVGPKTAAKLLTEYGSLQGVWEHLQEQKSDKLRAALAEHRDIVGRNVGLVRLRCDLESPLGWEQMQVREPDREALLAFFQRFELNSMARELQDKA